MNYREALSYLDDHVNLEARAGAIHGLSLDHMRALVGVLADPQESFRVIQVTGTNGKGSTSRIITELLRASGLTVGTYSSPHLQAVNERLAIDGEPISDEEFAAIVTAVARVEPLSGIVPSYFELLTAAAFLWFAENAVDVAVVEVGLLGRYDATNVCAADVAVVTNIGKDHTDGVGEWRYAIASEKAGIIDPRSTLVSAVRESDLRAILEAEGPERSLFVDRDFEVVDDRPAIGGRVIDVVTPWGRLDEVIVPLHGLHQSENALCAIAAVEAFFDRELDDAVVAEAMGRVTVPGRFEVVAHAPLLILDGAHNPDGARTLAATLHAEFEIGGRLVLVLGMLEGRDLHEMLTAFDVARADLVIATRPDSLRAVATDDLATMVRAMGVMVEVIDDVPTAVQRAIDVSTEDDAIVVSGSLYTVGAARTWLTTLVRDEERGGD